MKRIFLSFLLIIFYFNYNNKLTIYRFYTIYNKCFKIFSSNKCKKSKITYNSYKYGYEYYSELLNTSNCSVCNSFLYHSHNIEYNNELFVSHRSYMSYKRTFGNKYSNELYGTTIVQDRIYNNQHPSNCDNKKYLIIPYWGSGLGSQIHVMGAYLALAINTNRIALINPTIINKYFLPLSNCSINFNISYKNKSYNAYSNYKFVFQKKYTYKNYNYPRTIIPSFIFEMLYKSPILPSHYLHYWRIQASIYIYNLKRNTRRIVNHQIHKYLVYNKKRNEINNYPCINVWIRHGDKYKEMKLIDTKYYFTAIKLFERLSNIKFNIYLSTDDRAAIDTFALSNYTVYYLNYSRYNDNNSNWKINHIYNVISDIELSLQCIAFIGTRKSNINRLIDELRCTEDRYSNTPYFEIGEIHKTNCSNNNLEVDEYW